MYLKVSQQQTKVNLEKTLRILIKYILHEEYFITHYSENLL